MIWYEVRQAVVRFSVCLDALHILQLNRVAFTYSVTVMVQMLSGGMAREVWHGKAQSIRILWKLKYSTIGIWLYDEHNRVLSFPGRMGWKLYTAYGTIRKPIFRNTQTRLPLRY